MLSLSVFAGRQVLPVCVRAVREGEKRATVDAQGGGGCARPAADLTSGTEWVIPGQKARRVKSATGQKFNRSNARLVKYATGQAGDGPKGVSVAAARS